MEENFYKLWENARKCNFLLNSKEKSFWNFKMKHCMSSGESLWWSVIFINCYANDQWSFSFCNPLQVFSFFLFLLLLWFFGQLCFKAPLWRLLLEQYCSFKDLEIKPCGLLQVPSLLNDNSLLKTFLQRSMIWLCAIVISIYNCNFIWLQVAVTFCIWFLYFIHV